MATRRSPAYIFLPAAIAGVVLIAITLTLWFWNRPDDKPRPSSSSTDQRIEAALTFAREACLAEPTRSKQSDVADAAAEARLSGLLKGKVSVTKEELQVIVDQAIPARDRAGQYDKIRDCIKDRVLLYLSNGSENITHEPLGVIERKSEVIGQEERASSERISEDALPTAGLPAIPAKSVDQAPEPVIRKGSQAHLWIAYASLWRSMELHVAINGREVGVFQEGKGSICVPMLLRDVAPGDTWEVWGIVVSQTETLPRMEYNLFPAGSGTFRDPIEPDMSVEFGRKMADGTTSVSILRGAPDAAWC